MNAIKVFFIASMCIVIGHRCFTAKLNIRKCKLTHSGIEYRGNVFITKFKSLCRPWNSIGVEPDSNFADGSRVSAKNFCRNPNGTRDDLWCYTYNVDNSVELCAVPLCYAKSKTRCRDECRLTGPGVEYGGYANVTKSGYACSKWSDVEDSSAADSKFPDGGRSAAGNRCRNPTGDPGGPWCYTFVDRVTVSDYCDTPSCDDGVCHWTFINGGWSSGHGHYTTMPISIKDDDGGGGGLVSFELKTWHPAIIRTDQPLFRVSLTAYPTVSSGDGFEVPVPIDVFARSGTAEIARVDVSWRNGFVVLSAGNPSASREVSSLELNATLSPMVYLSFTGDYSTAAPVAVRFVHCDLRTAGQEEHVTNSQDAYRIFPLKKSIVSTSELSFSVRAVISASVTYYTTPTKQTPRLIMEFAAWPVQKIKIIFIEKSNSEEQMIFNQTYEMDVISYWKWHQYEITIADKILQIQATDERDKNPTIMLKITDSKLRFFHWFTIGSKTVAHWTLYCNGPEFYPLPEATLPECVISKTSENYRGTQWITENGIPCVPWNVSSVRKLVKERTLIDRSYVKAKNYCRNPTKDPDGPYCYVVVGGRENAAVEKRSCRVRKCRNTRCSVTGIATDYVGKLNKTVSNRTCLKWSSHTGAGYAFPDGSALAASNYCRNPTRAPTGAWCRVGGAAETDSCDVPACSEDGGGGGGDSDTLLIGGDGVHWMHVLPDWRGQSGLRMRLKRWAPGVYEGASLRFRRPGHPSTYDLVQVGADGDEKIKLYRLMSRNEERRLATTAADDEIVYPHLLMASRWTELVFRLGDDDRGEDGQSITTVTMSSAAGGEIFSWTLSSNSTDGGGGRIAFVGLSAITSRGYVATRFPAEEDCLIHSSESQNFSVFLPINVRSNRSLTSAKPEIVFRIKHTGVTCIALMSRKFSERHVLEINGGRAVLWNEGKRSKKSLGEYESKTGEIFTAGNWTRILLSWNESVLRMDCGGVHGWHWNVGRERPLLVRYFSVANRGGGRTKWTVNCDESWRRLPDVDGPPRDGGWGEWGQWERCTKSCGGGTGVRSRRCDSPRPNVSGRPCPGPAMAAGACNQHECGQVSVKTAAAVRRLLAGRAHNAAATVGDRLTILCDPATVDAIRADSPRARFRWLRNGKTATSTIADDKTDRCALVIGSCTIHDSGVYAFVAEPPKSERIVLKLFAVAINDKPISVYIGDVVRVQCNAATLSYFFNRLSQEWLVNDSYVIKNYGINSLASIDVDTITIENKHFQGIWKCVVRSTEINSTWVTNAMEIKVIGLSTRWTQIMQDPIIKILFRNRSPTTIILICTILISTLCVGTWCCAYIFNRWRKQITNKSSKGIQIKDYGIHKKVPYQHL